MLELAHRGTSTAQFRPKNPRAAIKEPTRSRESIRGRDWTHPLIQQITHGSVYIELFYLRVLAWKYILYTFDSD